MNLINQMVFIDREIAKAMFNVQFLTAHHRSTGQQNVWINKRIHIKIENNRIQLIVWTNLTAMILDSMDYIQVCCSSASFQCKLLGFFPLKTMNSQKSWVTEKRRERNMWQEIIKSQHGESIHDCSLSKEKLGAISTTRKKLNTKEKRVFHTMGW